MHKLPEVPEDSILAHRWTMVLSRQERHNLLLSYILLLQILLGCCVEFVSNLFPQITLAIVQSFPPVQN